MSRANVYHKIRQLETNIKPTVNAVENGHMAILMRAVVTEKALQNAKEQALADPPKACASRPTKKRKRDSSGEELESK